MIVMKILRFLLNKFFVLAFGLLLFGSISLQIYSTTAGDRNTVLAWLEDSEVYETITPAIFEVLESQAKNSSTNSESTTKILESGVIDTDQLKQIMSEVYDSDFTQSQGDGAVNGIYDWLEGEEESVDFSLSLKSRANILESRLKANLNDQLARLPFCDDTPTAENAFNLLTATCLPADLSVDEEIDKVLEEVIAGEDAPLQAEFNASESFEQYAQDLKDAPDAHRFAKNSRYLVMIAVVVVAGLIIITSKPKASGVKSVGGSMVSVGISTLISFGFLYAFAGSVKQTLLDGAAEELDKILAETIFGPLFETVGLDIAKTGLLTGGVVLLLGILVWLTGYRLVKASEESSDQSSPAKTEQAFKTDGNQMPKPQLPGDPNVEHLPLSPESKSVETQSVMDDSAENSDQPTDSAG